MKELVVREEIYRLRGVLILAGIVLWMVALLAFYAVGKEVALLFLALGYPVFFLGQGMSWVVEEKICHEDREKLTLEAIGLESYMIPKEVE